MARAKKEEGQIVKTNMPIPDAEAPLVIDLPDGQKIVLGQIKSGAVIEVATWRGTGRPDSRTNRIMLGMSDADTQATKSEEESVPKVSKKLKFKFPPFAKLNILTNKYLSKPPVEETHNLEIDAWIEKISSELSSKDVKSEAVLPKKSA